MSNKQTWDCSKCSESNVTATLSNEVLTIRGFGAMKNYGNGTLPPWHLSETIISTVVVENGITEIGDYAFIDCIGLVDVAIPNSVVYVGNHAFANCIKLPAVTIPNSVIIIGCKAFSNCGEFLEVTIPNSVKNIGCLAFSGCNKLTSVTIGESAEYIGDYAFTGCSNLTKVINKRTIPQSIEKTVFCNVDKATHTLWVGKTAIDNYKSSNSAKIWKDFEIEIINAE